MYKSKTFYTDLRALSLPEEPLVIIYYSYTTYQVCNSFNLHLCHQVVHDHHVNNSLQKMSYGTDYKMSFRFHSLIKYMYNTIGKKCRKRINQNMLAAKIGESQTKIFMPHKIHGDIEI